MKSKRKETILKAEKKNNIKYQQQHYKSNSPKKNKKRRRDTNPCGQPDISMESTNNFKVKSTHIYKQLWMYNVFCTVTAFACRDTFFFCVLLRFRYNFFFICFVAKRADEPRVWIKKHLNAHEQEKKILRHWTDIHSVHFEIFFFSNSSNVIEFKVLMKFHT